MAKFGRWFASFLIQASVVLLFASLLLLFIVFFLNAKAGERFGTMWKGLAASGFGTVLATVVFRGLTRRLKEQPTKSVSDILVVWLRDESLLQAFIWVFVFVALGVLSYLAPIYSLHVSVAGASAPLGDGVRVVTNRNLVLQRESPRSTAIGFFRSNRSFRWGDTVRIRVTGAARYSDDTQLVQWPEPAFMHVLGSVPVPIQLQPLEAKLTIEAPRQATITLQVGDTRSQFKAPKDTVLPRNSAVDLAATAPGYVPFGTSFILKHDTAITIAMARTPGTIRVLAVNQGGDRLENLEVFIDSAGRRFKVGTLGAAIQLPPDTYQLEVELTGTEDITFAGPFPVTVIAGQSKTCRLRTTTRAHGTPAPPRGGERLSC